MVQWGSQKGHLAGAACQQVFVLTSLLFAFVMVSSLAYAAPGDRDDTFGTGGIVTTPIGSGDDIGYSAAIQSDGKIVVAGRCHNGTDHDFAIVRYNNDGTIDSTFGIGGKVTTPVGAGDDIGYSVAIQTDDKIVAAGYTHNGANNDLAVVRYNRDGTLDSSFDSDGKVSTPIGSGDDVGYSVAIQTDGKIVVTGLTHNGTYNDFAVVRYNSDGTLDTSFDADGIATTTMGGDGYAKSVAIQSDGKIVAAGFAFTGSNEDFAVVRYNSDGSLDSSFDTDGMTTTAVGGIVELGNSIAIQPDGKIVVAGFTFDGTQEDFAVVRYNSDGSLDSSFDTDGIVTTALGSHSDQGESAAVQPDGKIVVAGYSNDGTYDDFAVVRYNSDGSLDTSFGADGIVTTPIGGLNENGYSAAIQPDGKIVAAGYYSNGSNNDFAVVRYHGDTAPSVTTADVSSITADSAKCGGEVTGDGGAGVMDIAPADVTARGVCFSTSANPTIDDTVTADGSGVGTFTSNITGLTPETKYYVRAYATNFVGTSYGRERTFTTTEDTGSSGGGGGGCFMSSVL